MMMARKSYAAIVWVGDTRVYRKRGQQFDQLTVDHSEHQERLERGDINTILRNDTNIVTRAVGGAELLRASTVRQGVQSGDRFLICSDGVHQELPAFQIASLLNSGSSVTACNSIIESVLDGRAPDNASAVVVDIVAI